MHRHRETPLGQRLQLIPMCRWHGAGHAHDFITCHDQRTCCSNRRIQLTERAGGCIARIGKRFISPFYHAPIEGLKVVEAHIDFAPHNEMVRDPGVHLQLQRERTDRAKIDGDIFSSRSIASCRTTSKDSMVVHQFDREPIEFRFDAVLDG